MRRKVTIGAILFVAGILLSVVSEITDIWILGVIGDIFFPVGLVMGTNALVALKNNKESN